MEGLFLAYIPAEEAGEYSALDAGAFSLFLSAFCRHFDADSAADFIEEIAEKLSFEDVEFLEVFVEDLVGAMKTRGTVQDNPKLLLIVRHYLLQLDRSIQYQPDEDYWSWKEREQNLVRSLRSHMEELGAVVSECADGSTNIVLLGVKVSSANGLIEACDNWLAVADARIGMEASDD